MTFSRILFFHQHQLNGINQIWIFVTLLYIKLYKKKPRSNNVFNVSHSKRFIFLTRLCVFFSHLGKYNFKHSFLDTSIPICICSFDTETLTQFFLHWPRFTNERQNLIKTERNHPRHFQKSRHQYYVNTSLRRSEFFRKLNTNMLSSSIGYILSTKSFEFHYAWLLSWFLYILFIFI